MTILKDLNFSSNHSETFELKGWITNLRSSKTIYFFVLNDGSLFEGIQIVAKKNTVKDFENLTKIKLGASIQVKGKVVKSKGTQQSYEIIADNIQILKNTTDNFPLQKKETSRNFLREIPHHRHRTKLINAVMRIRSFASWAIHDFFQQNNFFYFSSPILTSNDGEGAGEAFEVKAEDEKLFFGKKATLGVTGQLQAEAYANGMGRVYTFAPTFRAEKSHTSKHLAEFWMIEPEACFMNLDETIVLAEKMLKKIVTSILNKAQKELVYLESYSKINLIARLKKIQSSNIKVIEYKNAVKILEKNSFCFEEKNIFFGMDLKTEHERFLAEKHFKNPIAVKNYPKEIKSFYMYQNDDGTVRSFDLLIPGVGELIGGSQREDRYERLLARIKELNILNKNIEWYLEIRQEGFPGSSGFGLGFERLIMYLTGIDNIKDVIPFPRVHNQLFA